MTNVKITNATTPASVGADVLATEDGTVSHWQFVIIGGRLFFACRLSDSWSPVAPIVAPERFGEYGPTFRALSAWVARFFEGGN